MFLCFPFNIICNCYKANIQAVINALDVGIITRNNLPSGWAVGDIVIHKKLGRGVVIALEGDDIITVNFDEHGEKSILGSHPSVSKGGHSA